MEEGDEVGADGIEATDVVSRGAAGFEESSQGSCLTGVDSGVLHGVEFPVAGQTGCLALRHREGWGQGVGPGDPCALARVQELVGGRASLDGVGCCS